MGRAVGLIEVHGFTAALVAADAAAKAAPVEIVAMEDTRPLAENGSIPVTVVVKLQGDVAAVTAAVLAGKRASQKVCGDSAILTHVIPRPGDQLEFMIRKGTVGPK